MRLVICDDSALLRTALARLAEDAGVDVVATAADGEQLAAAVDRTLPDVVLVDVRMPPTWSDEGLRAAVALRQRTPAPAVLLLSTVVQSGQALRLLLEGGRSVGYLLKDRVTSPDELVDALRRVCAGEVVLDPEVSRALVARARPTVPLTPREQEVLALMAEGLSNTAICARLCLSPKTVETHIAHVFDKLGVSDVPDGHKRVLSVLAHLHGSTA